MPTEFTSAEVEVLFLKTTVDQVNDMVNREVFQILGTSPEVEVRFWSMSQRNYFYVLLHDYLSVADKEIVPGKRSFLGALRDVVSDPQLGTDGDARPLRQAVNAFSEWLNFEATIPLWLPAHDAELEAKIPRITFLKICGNTSKHSMLRRAGPARELRAILARSGLQLTFEEALLVLEEFYARFREDILIYHAGTIAEMLNELRWGVHEYLQSEFQRSFEAKGGSPPRWGYRYPDSVVNALARGAYWDLMEDTHKRPWISRFEVTKHMKRLY
ncbi:MAG: hypothetical protein DRQ55_03920 [Planctomycetota bacterium]|nr:MAG: hypothetical protein DRQ55_03920 [Planctomycetota bacterium]